MIRSLCAVVLLAPTLSLAAVPLPTGLDADRAVAPHFVIQGSDDGRALERLPLEATTAGIEVAGVIAHVRVRQVWRNRGETPIEASYVFPGSTRSAVFGMRMRIGDRVLKAKIDRRDAARKLYERAKEEGKTASLLEQERPNVFSMNVANILPGDRIEVELDYTELLVPEEKVYELVYPQAVGPRYAKSDAADAADTGERWQANPYLKTGEGAPWRWGVDVRLSTGVTLRDVSSTTHAIEPTFTAADEATVAVGGEAGSAGGARDFVLRYRLVGDDIETGVLLFRGDKGATGPDGESFFLVMAQPPERVSDEQMPPRELVFVVDVSGSMNGFPLETSKALMRRLLGALRPVDTFNVLFFAGGSYLLSEHSLRATPDNLARALKAVDQQRGGGGTNLDLALDRAFSLPTDTGTTSRSFVVLTDGYVSFEPEIFDLVRNRAGEANVYAFGIGSSVNRHLIEQLARASLGQTFVVNEPGRAVAESARFVRTLSRPALTNVRVFFEGFDAYDVEPSAPRDLLEDRPLILFGKYRGPSTGRVRITGTAGDRSFEQTLPVEDHLEKKSHEALRYLWARSRIERLADLGTPTPDEVEKVTQLGLRYSLLTKYTSFVAVDYVVRNAAKASEQVAQPQPLPHGVRGDVPRHPKHTLMDFSLDSIEGELKRPDGAYLESRKSMKHGSMIPVRESFSDKLLADGAGGLGLVGTGAGGGGAGYGRGVGGLGRIGSTRSGAIDLGGRGKGVTRVRTGKPIIFGSLDKGIIQRVIRSRKNAVRFCYERELQRDPKLAGRLVIELTISPQGDVTKARVKEDTLQNKGVASCVLAKMKTLRFPAPKGSGAVIVTYPYVFKSGS
jgi:Ca-activated chloride channel family protein